MSLVTCLHPRIVRNRYTHEVICVPCGRCSACLASRAGLWTARLREESACHPYCIFGTLTYDDSHLPRIDVKSLDSKFFTPAFCKAYDNSKDYIDYNNGVIPFLNIKDIQNFFKRLRSKISYYHGTQSLRYFLVGEYGPTTYRPHFHYLLWFDNRELVPKIKDYIYQAWKSNTPFAQLPEGFSDEYCQRKFFERNKHSFVYGHAESYVAQYLNMFSKLPEILSQKPFRPWHVQSSCPPIGTLRLLRDSVPQLLDGDVMQVNLRRLSSSELVNVPLWRGLENRLFPKCQGYSSLTYGERVFLYSLFAKCPEPQRVDFKTFTKWFFSQDYTVNFPVREFDKFFCYFKLHYELLELSSEEFKKVFKKGISSSFVIDFDLLPSFRSFYSLYQLSRRVFFLSLSVNSSVEDYVLRIENYYSRKEYMGLLGQVKFQEQLSNSPRDDEDLRYYPFLVDSMFYENLRKLPHTVYMDYIEQFGLSEKSMIFFTNMFSREYNRVKEFSDKIYNDNCKVRIKKDYIAQHPECYQNYVSLLKPFKI